MNHYIPECIPEFISLIGQSVVNWVAPLKCIRCSQSIRNGTSCVCQHCYPTLPFHDNACQQCGQAFSANLDYCGRCLNSPPPFDRCFCAFSYNNPIDNQLRKFKYSQRPELAGQLAQLLRHEIDNHQLDYPELLLPVPIHISKLRERGFNQSLSLAKHLSALMNIPYSNNVVIKHRNTEPQVGQTQHFRHKNVSGSFKYHHKTKAKHIAIIDDVVTTGSTAAEIAKILKRNGVDYIQVWAIAQTTQ